MKTFDTKVMAAVRASIVALLLTFAISTSGSVSAQTATEVPEAAQVEEEDEGGFDDWGLLGLLGLLGLAGLRKRPDHVVGAVEHDGTTRPRA